MGNVLMAVDSPGGLRVISATIEATPRPTVSPPTELLQPMVFGFFQGVGLTLLVLCVIFYRRAKRR